MNDRQLRYACAVWRERGFSRAAEKLNVSQPSLSDQVRALEEEIGFELFYRGGRGIEPSVNGKAFLEVAERVVEDLAGLKEFGNELRGKAGTRLRIGISSGIAQAMVPRIITGLSNLGRKIYPEVLTATSRRIQRLVSQHRLDFGLLFENQSSHSQYNLITEQMTSAEIVVLLPPAHALAARGRPLTLSEIASHSLILSEPRLGYGQATIKAFSNSDLEPNIVADCDNTESLKYMVLAGAGLGLVPRLSVESELKAGTFAALSFEPKLTVNVQLVRRPEPLPDRVEQSMEHLIKEFRQFLGSVAP